MQSTLPHRGDVAPFVKLDTFPHDKLNKDSAMTHLLPFPIDKRLHRRDIRALEHRPEWEHPVQVQAFPIRLMLQRVGEP